MRSGRRSPLSGVLAAALVLGACQNRGKPSDAAPASAAARSAPPAATERARIEPASSGKLPEDPEAGARSVAQWREHLEREERERRLGYDGRKLHEHEAVLKKLRGARASYDAAGSKEAVLKAERAFLATRPKLDAAFEAIDHWGTNSKVLPDYRKLVETFSDAYPTSRIAALAGDKAAFERVAREVDERLRTVDVWLHEAEESEDE